MTLTEKLGIEKNKALFLIEFTFTLLILAILYNHTVGPMVELWLTSETYSHGILIIPLAMYLMYEKLTGSHLVTRSSLLAGLVIMLGAGCLLLFASLISINVVQQFALMTLIPGYVLARFGWQKLMELKGPLLFLFFAIPTGDFLIPFLQQITADISVYLVRLTGIPVYHDGLYITIPQANFLVAEACSGIRFLISSFTLGVFYSLMFIDGWKKRLAFVALSFSLPILANGLRVFMIVLIAYYIDVESATGFDHIVYGWVFFSFVIILLLYTGNFFASDKKDNQNKKSYEYKKGSIPSYAVLSSLAIPAVLLHLLVSSPVDSNPSGEIKVANSVTWQPLYENFDDQRYQVLEDNAHYFAFTYLSEYDEKELVNFNNKLFDNTSWALKSQSKVNATVKNQSVPVSVSQITNLRGERVNILQLYQIGNDYTSGKLNVKLAQLVNKLSRTDMGGKVHIMSANEKVMPLPELLNLFEQQVSNQ